MYIGDGFGEGIVNVIHLGFLNIREELEIHLTEHQQIYKKWCREFMYKIDPDAD